MHMLFDVVFDVQSMNRAQIHTIGLSCSLETRTLLESLALNGSLMMVHAGEEPTLVRVEPAVVLFTFPLPCPSAGAENPRDGGLLAACRSLSVHC